MSAEAFAAAPRHARELPGGSSRLQRELRTVGMIVRRELIRFKRSPVRIVTGLAQPVIFLFVLGSGLTRLIGSGDAGGVDFQAYLFPGVIAMSVLFSSVFSAISIVWDREFGFLREMLVAPVSRGSLVVGKCLGGATISSAQGMLLLFTAPLVGVHLSVLKVILLAAVLLVLSFSLNAFGVVIASRMQKIESFQVVMTLVVNPMLFFSGALFPLSGLPTWLAVATRLNPATYGVDAVRRAVLGDAGALTIGATVVPIWADVAVMVLLGAMMLAVAVRSFRPGD